MNNYDNINNYKILIHSVSNIISIVAIIATILAIFKVASSPDRVVGYKVLSILILANVIIVLNLNYENYLIIDNLFCRDIFVSLFINIGFNAYLSLITNLKIIPCPSSHTSNGYPEEKNVYIPASIYSYTHPRLRQLRTNQTSSKFDQKHLKSKSWKLHLLQAAMIFMALLASLMLLFPTGVFRYTHVLYTIKNYNMDIDHIYTAINLMIFFYQISQYKRVLKSENRILFKFFWFYLNSIILLNLILFFSFNLNLSILIDRGFGFQIELINIYNCFLIIFNFLIFDCVTTLLNLIVIASLFK